MEISGKGGGIGERTRKRDEVERGKRRRLPPLRVLKGLKEGRGGEETREMEKRVRILNGSKFDFRFLYNIYEIRSSEDRDVGFGV